MHAALWLQQSRLTELSFCTRNTRTTRLFHKVMEKLCESTEKNKLFTANLAEVQRGRSAKCAEKINHRTKEIQLHLERDSDPKLDF